MYPEKTVLANTVTVEADKQSDLLGEKELKAPEGCQQQKYIKTVHIMFKRILTKQLNHGKVKNKEAQQVDDEV